MMRYIKSKSLFEGIDKEFTEIIQNCNDILLDINDMGVRSYVNRSKENITHNQLNKVSSIYRIEIYVNNYTDVDDSYLIDTRSRLIEYLESEGFTYLSSSAPDSYYRNETPVYGAGGHHLPPKEIEGVGHSNLWKFKKET